MVRYAMVIVVGVMLACPIVAVGQSDTKSAANTLFEEGRALIDAGEIEHACQKFEASLQMLDQLGVRLNYADCLERQGKTAAAWTEFREGAERAKRRGDTDRLVFATQRAKALEPRLVKLQILVTEKSRVPGLLVQRDGIEIPAAAYGSSLPINPASYTIEASAKGYKTWRTSIDAQEQGKTISVEVPLLEETVPGSTEAGDNANTKVASADDSARRKRYKLAIGLGASGLVTFAAGLGVRAETGTFRDVGTVVAGVGMTAMITALFLYILAPEARPTLSRTYLDVHGSDHDSSIGFGFLGRF